MVDLPNDLIPLPTMPYSERPDSLPLDVEACRTALWRTNGNVTEASKLLKISSGRLRSLINNSSYLTRELAETREQLVDRAEQVVIEALEDSENTARQDAMARFVINSAIGRSRGYGSGATKINVNNNGGNIVIGWQDGSMFEDPKTIEAEFTDITMK